MYWQNEEEKGKYTRPYLLQSSRWCMGEIMRSSWRM